MQRNAQWRNRLSGTATGRHSSMFDADMATAAESIRDRVANKRVLAIGGAGSIGSSTVKVIADFKPAALHVIDQNENEGAELVRGLRSRPEGLDLPSFRVLPIDYGSQIMRSFLHDSGPYDIILNFAAIKHVRSEKDAASTLQMFDTNLRKQAQLLRWMAEVGFCGNYFSVSTDKAANPSSMMGATKRAMEHVMFSRETNAGNWTVTSARFANVAYSNGSLLQSFERRLAAGEPLAVPLDTRRYFVSLQESGQICTLATFCPETRHIAVPKLDPNDHLVLLQSVAERYLALHDLEPEYFSDEAEARRSVEKVRATGRWPLLLTPLDTAGEKPYEEFVAHGEQVVEVGLPGLAAVPYRPAAEGAVARLVSRLEGLFGPADGPPQSLDKDALKSLLVDLEPAFAKTHRDSPRTLDDRV